MATASLTAVGRALSSGSPSQPSSAPPTQLSTSFRPHPQQQNLYQQQQQQQQPQLVAPLRSASRNPASANAYFEISDPQTGRPFYANIVTGECSWDRPANAVIHPKDPSGDEWWELFDDSHKLPYYYNAKTAQTQWTKPDAAFVIPLSAIQNSAIGRRVTSAMAKRPVQSKQSPGPSPSPSSPYTYASTPTIPRQYQPSPQQSSPSLSYQPPMTPASVGGSTLPRMRSSEYSSGGRSMSHDAGRRRPNLNEKYSGADSPEAMSPLRSLTVKAPPPKPSNPALESLPKIRPERLLPDDLKRHIALFQIDGFAKKYFAERRSGIFRRVVPVESLLVYSKDSIRQPLMNLPRAHHKEALRCFKIVCKIIGDTSRGPPFSGSVKDTQQLLEIGISEGTLRDEIYVQVCKQVTKNPNSEATYRGWILLSVLTTAFPPSKNLEAYLRSFMMQHFDGVPTAWAAENPQLFQWCYGEEGLRVGAVACHAHRSLLRVSRVGARGRGLTIAEVERAQEAPFHPILFGETLEEIMRSQREEEEKELRKAGGAPDGMTHLSVPKILLFLTDAILRLNGCQTEGIFRVPGDIDMVNDLRVRVEKGLYDLSGISDPNVPSSLLKLWLRELAEPLIPSDKYDLCVTVGHQQEDPSAGEAAVEILKTLPEINRKVALYVVKFLKVVADPTNQSYTKMTPANIAMVFAPNFLRCPSDDPTVIFESTKYEQAFLRVLMTQSNLQGL